MGRTCTPCSGSARLQSIHSLGENKKHYYVALSWWVLRTPQTSLAVELARDLSHQIATVNHEDCHSKFQNWNGDAKVTRGLQVDDHISPLVMLNINLEQCLYF
jgi:hypothetical protein